MAKEKKGTAMVSWEDRLAEEAEAAAKQEQNVAAGQFFSVKSGVLTWNDAPVPGNQMAVVILDGVLENVYYEDEYDPDNPAGPKCFAFGRADDEMKPHEIVVTAETAQSETCTGCPQNEWGTANKGKGKACRNTRRLGLIPAGDLDLKTGEFTAEESVDHYETASVGYLRLPVTSVKGYASFVKSVASSLRRPPHGIFAKVIVQPDSKTQFKITFEPLASIPDELMDTVMKRHDEVKGLIEFPYTPFEAREEKPKGTPARPGKKPKF